MARRLLTLVLVACYVALAALLWTGKAQRVPAQLGIQDDITAIATNLDNCVMKGTSK